MIARSLRLWPAHCRSAVTRSWRRRATRAVERCLRFASEGWSAARLVDPQEGWIDGLRWLSERLLRASTAGVTPVSVIVNTDGSYTKIEAELSELVDVAEQFGLEPAVAMTIILDGIAAGTAPRFAVAA